MNPLLCCVIIVAEFARPVKHIRVFYSFLQVVIVDDCSHWLCLNQMDSIIEVLAATPECIIVDLFVSINIIVILKLLQFGLCCETNLLISIA